MVKILRIRNFHCQEQKGQWNENLDRRKLILASVEIYEAARAQRKQDMLP
jgi:hypothetical protein